MPRGPSLWFDIRVYLVVAIALLMVILYYNIYLAVLGAILVYALYLYGKERLKEGQKAFAEYIRSMKHSIDQASAYALQNLPIAIAIVDQGGRLNWCNGILKEWVGDIPPGQPLTEAFNGLDISLIWGTDGTRIVTRGDRHYQIVH